MPEKRFKPFVPSTLDWVLLYIGVVVVLHLIAIAVLLRYWPEQAPVRVWDFVVGIVAAAVVAILAGIITICISARSAYDLERATVRSITSRVRKRLEQALSAPITTLAALRGAVNRVIEASNDSGENSILLLELAPTSEVWDGKTADLLHKRLVMNAPTWLVVSVPDCAATGLSQMSEREREFWKVVCGAGSETRFDDRRFLICPKDNPSPAVAARLARSAGTERFEANECVVALEEPGKGRGMLGLRSAIDQGLSEAVIAKLCVSIDEPFGTYDARSITLSDLQQGRLSGLPVTRSLVTTQIITGVRNALSLNPGPQGTRVLPVADLDANADVRNEFRYAGDMFLPPVRAHSHNHSGSVLGQLIVSGELDVRDRGVLEVGCGPGFLTRQIARRLGSGRLVANDISERAVAIAKLNLNGEASHESHVVFLRADCRELSWRTEGSSPARLMLDAETHGVTVIDLVLVELPLLAYGGSRALHAVERPYMEKRGEVSSLLPQSLASFVQRSAPLWRQCSVEVVVPVCASSDAELEVVRTELGHLSGCLWTDLGQPSHGFIRCLRTHGPVTSD